MECEKRYPISPKKKKKKESWSRLYKRVRGISVELSMNELMGIVVKPWMKLLRKIFQDFRGAVVERTWVFYEKFVSEVTKKICHLQLQTIKQYSDKRHERNISSMMEELKNLVKVLYSKDHIRVKNLHVVGPLQLGCSVTLSNQLEDVKNAEPCACDHCQDPLPSTPTFHDEEICRAELFEDNGEHEAEKDLSDINSDGDDAEINEGIIESCKGSKMHENNIDKACLDNDYSNDIKVNKGVVENYKGSNMHENSVDEVCLDDIDDGGTVCDFPHNPVFSHRFTGLKWLKSLGNFQCSSTWENDNKPRVTNGKAEDIALLQSIDLMSELTKTDNCSNLLVLNDIVGLKVEDKVKLKEDDNVTVGLKVEDKVKLKEDDNVTVGLKVEDKVKLKEDDNVTVGLKVEDKVKLKEDDNVTVGLKVEDKVKLKEDDNVTVGLKVEDKVKLKEDDNVTVGLKVEDKVKLKEDDNVTVALEVEDRVKLKEDDNVTVGLKVEDMVKLKGDHVTVGPKVENKLKLKGEDTFE